MDGKRSEPEGISSLQIRVQGRPASLSAGVMLNILQRVDGQPPLLVRDLEAEASNEERDGETADESDRNNEDDDSENKVGESADDP